MELILDTEGINAPVTIAVFTGKNNKEETRITFNIEEGEFFIDRNRSSLAKEPEKDVVKGAFCMENEKTLNIQIWIDHSTIEIFINKRYCLTTRVYPILEESNKIMLKTGEGTQEIQKFSLWTISQPK